ncbi:7966_t:CDS:10 [Ambispora leptoticha]|uniref:7966_t:CDS:1 n=1 Tax=Ambispora leptoticha TaxID=144679 RepID=A0A9N9CLH2_9GLOM|nr:7966_t:CDS:10 [Ambispora leptoticha]
MKPKIAMLVTDVEKDTYSHPGSKRGYVETIDDRLSKIEHVLTKYLEGADNQVQITDADKVENDSEIILPTHDLVNMASKLEEEGKLDPDKICETMSSLKLTKSSTIYLTITKEPNFLKSLKDKNNPPSILLLNSIFAVASIFSDDPRTRGDPDKPETVGDLFFERARDLLDDFMDRPRLSTIQALHFLAQFCVKSSRYSCRIWMYLGMAMSMARDLSLNRDCYKWDIGKAEKAVRNRVFWATYVGEVVACASFGKSLPVYDFDVRLPYELDDDGDDALDVINFMHLCKLSKILGNILQSKPYFSKPGFLRNTLPAIDAALSSWLLGLPSHLQCTLPANVDPEPASMTPFASFIHQMYNTILIHLHRPYMDSKEFPNIDSRQICIQAATNITKLAICMPINRHGIYFSFSMTGYFLSQAGIIHQTLIPEPESSHHGIKNMEQTMKVLKSLGGETRVGGGNCGVDDCLKMLDALFRAQLAKLEENRAVRAAARKNWNERGVGGEGGGSRGSTDFESKNNKIKKKMSENFGNDRRKTQAKTIPTPPSSIQQDFEVSSNPPAFIKAESLPDQQLTGNISVGQSSVSVTLPKSPPPQQALHNNSHSTPQPPIVPSSETYYTNGIHNVANYAANNDHHQNTNNQIYNMNWTMDGYTEHYHHSNNSQTTVPNAGSDVSASGNVQNRSRHSSTASNDSMFRMHRDQLNTHYSTYSMSNEQNPPAILINHDHIINEEMHTGEEDRASQQQQQQTVLLRNQQQMATADPLVIETSHMQEEQLQNSSWNQWP